MCDNIKKPNDWLILNRKLWIGGGGGDIFSRN